MGWDLSTLKGDLKTLKGKIIESIKKKKNIKQTKKNLYYDFNWSIEDALKHMTSIKRNYRCKIGPYNNHQKIILLSDDNFLLSNQLIQNFVQLDENGYKEISQF